MKIVSITAGAAQMYCGSCLRDNTLAAELKRQGHDIILVPVYTPTLTDEPNVSANRVFFGGISVWLQEHIGLFRNTPALLDRLWDSRWALNLASKRSIDVNPKFLGRMTVSILKGEEGSLRKELRKLLLWLRSEAPPDVVTLPYSMLISLAQPIREALERPVCCTLQGDDSFLNGLPEPYRSESLDRIRANLRYVDAFLAVSEFHAEAMRRLLDIPAAKMHVVPLGINLKGSDPEFRFRTNCFTVGYFARVCPEKGLHLLCEAYHLLREKTEFSGATLEAAGYLAPEHRGYLSDIQRRIKEWGLEQEFQYRGALDRPRKLDFLRNLDILSVPATFDEPKGLSLLEAMANGVAVVEPRRGAYIEILEKTRGGVLVEPDNPEALAEAILKLWRDRDLLKKLGDDGARGVKEHYSAAAMASRAVQVYDNVVNASRPRAHV